MDLMALVRSILCCTCFFVSRKLVPTLGRMTHQWVINQEKDERNCPFCCLDSTKVPNI